MAEAPQQELVEPERESVNAFWWRVLRALGAWMGLATLTGWGFGMRGLVVAWWLGALVFFIHLALLVHDRYK